MAKRIPVLSLRPTQMALGMLEVRERVKELSRLDGGGLKRSVRKSEISVVIAPDKGAYVVDGHHHAYAFWSVGVKKVYFRVLKDYSATSLSHGGFWKKMRANGWAHLYDQFGHGPRDPVYLPDDVRGMSDDPYRSLAWLVERENGFERSPAPFAGFRWAAFFRRRRLLHDRFVRDFEAVLPRAIKAARSRAARRLPGFLGSRKK